MYNFILICEKLTKEEIRMKFIKGKRGITLIALVITTLFSYDEFIKSSNNKGFLLQTI